MEDGGSASIRGEDGRRGPNWDQNPCSTFLKGNGNGSDNAVIEKPPRGLIKKKRKNISFVHWDQNPCSTFYQANGSERLGPKSLLNISSKWIGNFLEKLFEIDLNSI